LWSVAYVVWNEEWGLDHLQRTRHGWNGNTKPQSRFGWSWKILARWIDATRISVGNGKKTPFLGRALVEWVKTERDIAPLIYLATTRKNWTIRKAIHENRWTGHINLDEIELHDRSVGTICFYIYGINFKTFIMTMISPLVLFPQMGIIRWQC
jgi:hypothetical protein